MGSWFDGSCGGEYSMIQREAFDLTVNWHNETAILEFISDETEIQCVRATPEGATRDEAKAELESWARAIYAKRADPFYNAAPELLAACEGLLEIAKAAREYGALESQDELDNEITRAEAIIAKATGESEGQ